MRSSFPGAAAMRTVLMERWDVQRGLSLIEKERISYMIGPPTIFTALMEDPAFAPSKVASMRVISSGMMGVTPRVHRGGTGRLRGHRQAQLRLDRSADRVDLHQCGPAGAMP